MYEEYYGFEQRPFQLLPNPYFLYRSRKHETALTHLEYGIYDRAGFVAITGEIGTGKTTLIRFMLQNLDRDVPVAFLSQTALGPEDFLRALCQEFSLDHEGKKKSELLELFGAYLVEQYQNGGYVILILDEAQNLSQETLEEIRMLSNLDADTEALLQIVLIGQPALRHKLQSESLRQLTQRISVSYHLDALNLEETREYIRYRLERAGGSDPELFQNGAVETVFAHSGGVPRLINSVCDLCLVYGMADDLRRIDRSLVETVLQDRAQWDLPSVSPAPKPHPNEIGNGSLDRIIERMDRLLTAYEETNRHLASLCEALSREPSPLREPYSEDELDGRINFLQARLVKAEQKIADTQKAHRLLIAKLKNNHPQISQIGADKNQDKKRRK